MTEYDIDVSEFETFASDLSFCDLSETIIRFCELPGASVGHG